MGKIKVGKPMVRPDTTSHTKGVEQGNARGHYEKSIGHKNNGTADARRSTGIAPKRHDAILPIMPNLPPG